MEDSDTALDVTKITPRFYGGIRRLPFLGIMIGLGILRKSFLFLPLWLIPAGVAAADPIVTATLMVALLLMVVSFIPVYYRLKNIGMNPWWCLLMLVPIANLLVGIRCLICQEGYADTKKLDTTGKVITYIVLGLTVAVIVALMGSVIVAVLGS